MSTIETVVNEADKFNDVEFSEDAVLMPFTGVTRMVLTLTDTAIVADTDVDATLIDWSLGDGVIRFKLNFLGVPASSRPRQASLKAYDPAHPNGQPLSCQSEGTLSFKFVDC